MFSSKSYYRYCSSRRRRHRRRRLAFSTDTMSKAVFYLFSPCLVFTSIADIELSVVISGG
jgi:hypothetical protein